MSALVLLGSGPMARAEIGVKAAEPTGLQDPDRALECAVWPRPHGWDDLGWIAQTDKRDAIRIYTRVGLHPILIHGIAQKGACTCGRASCGAIGKHPVSKGWQSAPVDVTALDDALIENWRFNIGLRMGAQPGGFRLVAIDVDGPLSLLAPLEAKHGPLPSTLTAVSGKGVHLIFKLGDDAPTPKNRVRMSEGVDIRSEGGQIVAAPSLHSSGRSYRWLDVREPAVLP